MKRLVLAILVVLSLAVGVNAQTFRGAINGTVTDPSGGVVPNAAVKATESTTGIDHTTTTTGDGAFSFQDIPLGFYKITVTASGFPVYTVDKVEVTAGTIYTLPVKLSLQQQSTTVEVSAAALTLDTTTETQNMTISSDVVQDIPLNGRDFTQLVAISPGYGGYAVGGFGSLNGTRPNQMNWQIDGVDNNDFWHNIPAVNQGGVSGIAGVVMPIDAIDEFSAQTQSGAEAGRNAGGTVNQVIKSGGNQLHGSLYYYNRNEFYGAHSPFFTPTPGTKAPPLRNENYGFSFGGPIIKNKTFFFTSYEKQDYIIGLSGLATEPSFAWQTKALDLLTNPSGKYGTYAQVSPSTLSQILIGNPATSTNPVLWPSLITSLPATLKNFFSPIASTGYSYNGVIKLDHNFSDKHHLSVRWFGGQGSQTAPLGGSPALGTASSNLKYYFEVAPIHVYNYSAVLNSTFTPKLTNQVLFGVNYFNQVFHDFNSSFDTKALGLFLSPGAIKLGKPILGAPNIVIGGFEQIGLTPPEGRNDITGMLADTVSYSTGKHQFRFGGEIRQGRVDEFYFRRGTGKFTFDGTQGPWSGATGCGATTPTPACAGVDPNTLALADFLAGDVQSASINIGNAERHVKVNAFNFFVGDAWQITRKLNINWGLRYEYFGPLHSSLKDLAVFIPTQGLKIQGNGIDSIFPPDKNNFAPRLGFAYQPTARNDLVVRGGVGVYYDQINMNPFLDFRPPISAASGLQGNPIGPSPVDSYARGSFTWVKDQQIFNGLTTCTTLNAATDPNCGTNKYNVYSVNQNFRAPYFYNYNLQVEKSFGSAAVLQVGYVGSQGRKLNIMLNITSPQLQAQYPNVGSIIQLNSVGTSNYNALQSTFRIRSWHGLSSTFGYTWSHALDEISEYRAVIADSLNTKVDYGNGDYDTRHLFTANFTYAIPKASWATGWSSRIVNNWEVTSLWNFHSGQPYDITRSGLNLVSNPFAGVNHKFSAAGGGTLWINPTAFCDPGATIAPGAPSCPGTAGGNLARNKFYGPGYGAVDLSVIKNIPITERVKVQLRADTFNLLNRINLASGPGSVSAGTGSTCAQDPVTSRCAAPTSKLYNGFGLDSDTIGDFNGAPGIGPGEAFNMQLAIKIIF
jgi:Carboxypeptidase regulatory-like domain